jgi:hypothetical protein
MPLAAATHEAQPNDRVSGGLSHRIQKLEQAVVFPCFAAQRPKTNKKAADPFGPPLESAIQR